MSYDNMKMDMEMDNQLTLNIDYNLKVIDTIKPSNEQII